MRDYWRDRGGDIEIEKERENWNEELSVSERERKRENESGRKEVIGLAKIAYSLQDTLVRT